jgi:hypothetical protein
MVKTEHRPAPLPTGQTTGPFGGGVGVPGKTPPPAGAKKMQAWYVDPKTHVRMRMPYLVPVGDDDEPSGHVRHCCPKKVSVNGGGTKDCDTTQWLLPGDMVQFCPRHGVKLEEPARGGRFLATVKDVSRLHGRSGAPWLVPAAGVAADVLFAANDVDGSAAVSVPLLAASAYYVTKRTLTARAIVRRRIEKGQRDGKRVREIVRRSRVAAGYAAEAGVWATAVAATDVTSIAGWIVWAAGMVRWAIGSKAWWDAAEVRRLRGVQAPVDVIAPAAEVQVDAVQVRAESTWTTLIGCANGPLAGTRLVEFKRLPACEVGAAERTRLPNWTAKVVAIVDGSINMRANRPDLLGRLAAAFRCTYADVSFSADESDVSVGWVRVQPDNVLAETKLWAGPKATDWRKGVSRIGRFDDGLPILYQWFTESGAAHDLIGGSSGGGKSELVAQLLLASLHSGGLVIDWVGDPQGGQSFGALKDAVDWFARDKTEITLMLLAAVKEMLRRNDVLARNNVKTWQPSKEMPLLVVTLDEVQSYIEDPDILTLVEMLAGQGRKCGIKMRIITQIIAAYNLGGSTYIKDQVKTGQTLTFRSETDVAGRSSVEGDSPIDPTALPKVWGPNTCAAGKTTAGLMFVQGIRARDVFGRADFTGNDMSVWLGDLSPGVFSAEAQEESGVLWGDRKARAARLLAAGRNDEDLLPKGKAVELIQAAATAQATNTVVRLSQPAPEVAGTARDLVLEAAKAAVGVDGVVTKRQIEQATPEMKDGTRNGALTELISAGKLHRVKNGVYEVPGVGRQQLEFEDSAAV